MPAGKVPDASKLLKDELGKAGNIKSRVTRQSVEAGIKSVQEKLKLAQGDVGIFVGSTSEGWVSELVQLPKPISGIIYRCDSSFFLDPIENMSEKGPKYAIICIDLNEVTMAFIQGTRLEITFRRRTGLIPASSEAGYSP